MSDVCAWTTLIVMVANIAAMAGMTAYNAHMNRRQFERLCDHPNRH